MASDTTTASGGIGFFGLLGILFITLKLTGFVDWSWWWILAPLWGPITLGALFIIFFGILTWKRP